MTKDEVKALKKQRKTAKKMDRKKYGGGKSGKAAKAADVAKQAALAKLKRIGEKGKNTDNTKVKDADTMDMPIADRERETDRGMTSQGPSMYGKKHGSSMYGKKHGSSMGHAKKPGASMYGKKHGSSMYHSKKQGSSMSGEKYDAKQAYNKSLSPKARLHYLENERHDKTSGHPIHKHMKKF
jgi:hypothetical protein